MAVVWITGVSGSGKSTMARALCAELRGAGRTVVELHGDDLRVALGNQRFDRSSRRELAQTYARLCMLLADQGLDVVIATISLFHEVHAWNRAHLPGYVEVLLNRTGDGDPKGFYAAHSAGALSDMVGKDQQAEFPLEPDFVFDGFPDTAAVRSVATTVMARPANDTKDAHAG